MTSRARSGTFQAAGNVPQTRRNIRTSIQAAGGLHWPPLAVEGALLKIAGQVISASRGVSELYANQKFAFVTLKQQATTADGKAAVSTAG